MAEDIRIGCTYSILRRGNLEVVFLKAMRKVLHVEHVSREFGVEDDGAIGVGGDAVEARKKPTHRWNF